MTRPTEDQADALGIRLFALEPEPKAGAKRRRQCAEWKKLRETVTALDHLLQQTLLADEALKLETHLDEVDDLIYELDKAFNSFQRACLQKIARYPHLPVEKQHAAFLDMKGHPDEAH